jgi:DNA processing protein
VSAIPAAAYLAALGGLPAMGPNRLRALLDGRTPERAWSIVREGRAAAVPALDGGLGRDPRGLAGLWRDRSRSVDPSALAKEHERLGVRLVAYGEEGYPTRLLEDPEPPAVLAVRGPAVDALEHPAVAIVGTRTCTREGRRTAARLGSDLASAGVAVVSGLALGIDAEAHRGALEVAPAGAVVGVVATGLDVVYPPANQWLWEAVVREGLLLSEAPLGTRAERWRFPARNRIVAGLADVVVVVESGVRGGSMHTVEAAIERDRPVLAVPGPISSRASQGTNNLLADQADLCRDAGDVFVALGLAGRPVSPGRATKERRPPPVGEDRVVLESVGWSATSIDDIIDVTGLSLTYAMSALQRLAVAGWVEGGGSWWVQRGPDA